MSFVRLLRPSFARSNTENFRIFRAQRLPCVLSTCGIVLFFLSPVRADQPHPSPQQTVRLNQELPQPNLTTSFQLSSYNAHISDSLLLQNRWDRSFLSYESVDVTLSYRLMDMVRLYSGGGFLFDQEPSHVKPGTVRFGVDFDSPWIFLGERIAPQISTEFKMHEEYSWNSDFSLRAGFRFFPTRDDIPAFTFMAEYFKGHSVHGQMYKSQVEYLGVGLHCKF